MDLLARYSFFDLESEFHTGTTGLSRIFYVIPEQHGHELYEIRTPVHQFRVPRELAAVEASSRIITFRFRSINCEHWFCAEVIAS
jgi:hypothetical protein